MNSTKEVRLAGARADIFVSDRDAQWALLVASMPMLHGYARRLVADVEIANEVLQEVSVRILAGIGPADPERFAAWSRGVVRHVIASHCRMRRRARAELQVEGEALEEVAADDFSDPESHLDARAWMARAIAGIDQEGLELLFRRYVLEETGKELADEFAQTPAALRMRLMRLRSAVSSRAPQR